MKKISLIIPALICACVTLSAKVTLPSVFSDNMVLQQQTDVAIWGTAEAGKTVTIRTTWSKDKVNVKAGDDGKWITRISTPAAGGPYEIRISDGEELTLKNVLIGEVWFCSGQSNMEMPMKGFNAQPVEGAADVIVGAHRSTPIRICTVTNQSSPVTKPVTCHWEENTPGKVAETSATAYFFARTLQAALEMPVGIIVTDWGGSSIEAWMTRDVLEKEFAGEFDFSHLDGAEYPAGRRHQLPSLLFNGQVADLVPFTFKGMLWYQGETNRDRPEQYTRLQTSYVRMMRELFHNPDAPFYFVQIAPYPYGKAESWMSGYFYEAQAATLKTIPHSGMAVTADIGEKGTIHPCKKEPVGKRLAYLALVNDYGMKGIEAEAPTYQSVTFGKEEAYVKVNVGAGLISPMAQMLEGFEIAGADKVFHPAHGYINSRDNTIIVICHEVPEPVAVRYCFRNWCVGTVYNSFGIPLAPFRTDDWDL